MHDRLFIAARLREIARLLEIKGENPFKARAFERGARALHGFDGDLGMLVENRRLTDIAGIGPGLAAAIEELYRTGSSSALELLRAELPPGAMELSRVPGLTVKKIVALQSALAIENLPDLKTACAQGLVRNVKGFGPKAEAKIFQAIEKLETSGERALLDHVLEQAEQLLRYLQNCAHVVQAEIAGAARRRKETVRRIQVVVASHEPAIVLDYFCRFPEIVETLEVSPGHCAARLAGDLEIEIDVVLPVDYASTLHNLTGSEKHLAQLEEIARARNGRTSIVKRADKSVLPIRPPDEKDIYRQLGMQYIPPELREGEGEVEAALSGALPALISTEDIEGMVHCHTVYSDGSHTVEQMARAAEAMGMKYLTITDHSPSAFYARGVKIDRLKQQWEEIARVQEKVKIRLLKGTESDILQDGSLDYPDPILEQFQIIIASIHQRAKMDADQMTRRILTAMNSPFFKIWGHPLGRLLLSRAPLECHMERVLDAIAAASAAVEINGDPRRLDLEPRWIRAARQRGIKFIVSTDAHSAQALQNLRYGVFMARRGWLTREDVLNTLSTDKFLKTVRP